MKMFSPESGSFSVTAERSTSLTALFQKSVIAALAIAALYFGRELFMPVAIAVLLAFALAPVVRFLKRLGAPKGVAVSVTVLLTFAGIFALGAGLTTQISHLAQELPRYQTSLKEKVRTIGSLAGSEGGAIDVASATLRDLGNELSKGPDAAATTRTPAGPAAAQPLPPHRVAVESYPPPPTAFEQMQSIIAVALAPLATAGVIVVLVIFLLLDQADVRDRLIRLAGAHDFERTTAALTEAGLRLGAYFLTLVAMNAGYGLFIGIGLWAIGLPNAMLWGILATVMRFIPYVGGLIAAGLPIVLAAAIGPGWSMLAMVVALYLVAEGAMNFIVEPLLQSSSTGMSTLAILLAAAFWTLLWGPIGLVIAIPMTALLVVLGRHVEGLHFLHVLLGDAPPLTPAQRFYQRMLARDPLEAAEQAEKQLKDMSLTSYYDDVIMEALRHAQTDADEGKLETGRLTDIRDSALPVVEAMAEIAAEPGPEEIASDLAAEWRAEGAVLCISGSSALDETGAAILAQLLQRRGLRPRLLTMGDIASVHLQGSAVEGARIACISMFDIANRGTFLRFLVRRLGRILPGVPLVGGFWRFDPEEPGHAQVLNAAPVSGHVQSLQEAVDRILAAARQDSKAAA